MTGIFGDKPWFRSMTAWGVILFTASEAGIGGACGGEAGLLSDATCAWLTSAMSSIGAILTVLGLRRAAN